MQKTVLNQGRTHQTNCPGCGGPVKIEGDPKWRGYIFQAHTDLTRNPLTSNLCTSSEALVAEEVLRALCPQ